MKIDFSKEQSITLAQVPIHVPRRGGKKVHSSTVYRWATKGARGRVLESVMVGGIRYTTIEAVRRFLNANSPVANMTRTGLQNELDQAIEDELRRAGV
jgi:L-asparaginase/Glu-tRNA(Gln) amidotransferase subunit D